jgi:hypothetical protein
MADAMRGAWVMESDVNDARIAALYEEMDAIHSANSGYWKKSKPAVAARAEYQRRQDRLEQIRAELAQLQAGRKGSKHPPDT